MDPRKVTTILDWESPNSVKAVQRFLDIANYYQKFIREFAALTTPLTRLLRKDVPFQWDIEAQQGFLRLKESFTTAPILVAPDDMKPFIVETDASNYALGAMLIQISATDGLEHPVAYYSRQLRSAEINYSTIEKELLAIKAALS